MIAGSPSLSSVTHAIFRLLFESPSENFQVRRKIGGMRPCFSILPDVPARQNAGPGRRAAWCRTKRLRKEKSLACDSIESGGFDKTASVGRSMGKGLIIGYGKKDIRPGRFGQGVPIKNREEADEDHPCEDRRRHLRKIRAWLTTGNAIWSSSWPM